MTKKIAFVSAVILVLAGTAAGCEQFQAPQGENAGGGSEPASPLVDYHVTGGLAGVDIRLVILEDGTARITRNRNPIERFNIGDRELGEIRTMLERGSWEDPIQGGGDVSVADGWRYEVVYRGRRVTAADPNVPPWMSAITAAMNEIAMPVQ